MTSEGKWGATDAVARANAGEPGGWQPWGYDGDRRALVFATRSSGAGARYLICWEPVYVRLALSRFGSRVHFAAGPDAMAMMRNPPPAYFLTADRVVLVILADQEEYC